jgi:hypothetical protein
MDKDVPGHITTRIISQRKLTVDGVPFQWWAVGERPALVTVRTPLFGALSDFTGGDVAVFAATLAKRVLADHNPRAEKARKVERTPALERPGWFEPGNTDYSSTVF